MVVKTKACLKAMQSMTSTRVLSAAIGLLKSALEEVSVKDENQDAGPIESQAGKQDFALLRSALEEGGGKGESQDAGPIES